MAPTPDLRSYLRSLSTETLAGLLCEQAERDPRLRGELEQRAARDGQGDSTVAEAHKLLDDAVPDRPRGDGPGGPDGVDHATTMSAVLDTLQRLLDGGSRADLAPLALRTVNKLGADLGTDPAGTVRSELERAIGLYARACRAHPPARGALADWLLEAAFERPNWPRIDVTPFAEALGESGLRRIKSAVDTVLADDSCTGQRRTTAERLLEQLAEASGDVDTLVEMLSRKLPRLDVSLKIVRVLRDAGRHTEAIAHAASALGPGKGPLRAPVVDALAETYHEVGQEDEALTLRRNEFRRAPGYDGYLALREAATGLGCWASERPAATELLAERAAADPALADDVVRALLAEGEADQAWRAADRYGGSLELRLELARGREAEHPAEVIDVYRSYVDELIAHRDVAGYRQAARQLRKLRTLHKRADKAEEFSAYLAELMETHKRKTRLLAEVRNARIALPKVTR
ncbi:DUF6880 family protein [Amycolatopsis cihanbeyliensis]|uniref:DUF6880 family protein n=1 Tax=Amycolatopsis cihanbeyliensis TaxID=1128664 RepID=UPI001FE54C9B|nr:DUF6880 family protein [Amycolatopsis cihanbeyliensis]